MSTQESQRFSEWTVVLHPRENTFHGPKTCRCGKRHTNEGLCMTAETAVVHNPSFLCFKTGWLNGIAFILEFLDDVLGVMAKRITVQA